MSHRKGPFVVVGILLASCAGSPPPAAPPPPAPVASASAAPIASAAPPAEASSAPPKDGRRDAAVLALEQEIAAVRACDGTAFSCPAFEAFVKERSEPQTPGAEDRLLAMLDDESRSVRFAALFRLGRQRGPRDVDPGRAKALLGIARKLELHDRNEAKWLGRVVGAVRLDTKEARDDMAAFLRDVSPDLAGATLVGIGVAHAREGAALDMVDAAATDPRPAIRAAVLDAYAEAIDRDPARSCAAWARALGDAPNEVRGAALLASTRECADRHAAVLAVATARLAKSPNDEMAIVLPHLCATKAVAPRVLALAKKIVLRVERGAWDDPMLAIAKCDPRGPETALRPYFRMGGDIGAAADRAMGEASER